MRVKDELAFLEVVPNKRLGQNFLTRPDVAAEIAEFAGDVAGSRVLEIGPGLGQLTEALLERGAAVTAVEVDKRLASHLRAKYHSLEKLQIVEQDIRTVSLAELLPSESEKFAVVGNVPYSISTDVVLWAIQEREKISICSMLFQQEFAERIAASPGTKQYGAISVAVGLYAEIELGPLISGTDFHPKANVDSRLAKFRFFPEPLARVDDLKIFRRVVRAAFSSRRKTILNSMSSDRSLFADKDVARQCLAGAGIDCGRRAETVSVQEYAALANLLVVD